MLTNSACSPTLQPKLAAPAGEFPETLGGDMAHQLFLEFLEEIKERLDFCVV